MKRALMVASVASMIDYFNRDNIQILLNEGYEVNIACNFQTGNTTSEERVKTFKNEMLVKGIKIFDIPIPRSIFKIRKILDSYAVLKRMINYDNYSLIHCHTPIGALVARLSSMNARKFGTKVIYTAHGFHFYKGAPLINNLVFYSIEKKLSKITDVIITLNTEDYKISLKKFVKSKTFYLPGVGIKKKSYDFNQEDNLDLRAKFNINIDDFLITNVGELSKRKNQKIAIKAISLIKNDNVKLLICGIGKKERELTKLVKKSNLIDRVIFAGYRQDVINILSISDAYIFPSIQEGLPVSVLEAMSVGLPIICSKIRGNSDLVVNGKNGFLNNFNDYKAFAKSIDDLLCNPRLRNQMKQNNLKSIKKYEIDLINNQMKKIYRELSFRD